MFKFTQANTLRAGLAAAAVALFASHAAYAAHPKEISYWADAQSASRAGNNDHGDSAQLADRGHKDHDTKQLAARAGDNDRAA